MMAGVIEFIPGEDADALAEVEVLEGHRWVTSQAALLAAETPESETGIAADLG